MLHFIDILPSVPFIIAGVGVTLKFTILSLLCGLPLGVGLALCKISHFSFLKNFSYIYTSVFRGTPLLVQLSLIFFATPQLTGYSISAFEAGVIAFSLNSAAYTSEIIRAGIEAIDQGQWDAAKVLGIPYKITLWKIIFPQALRNVLPALVNEMVNLLKESALVSIIGETDLLRRAQVVASEKFLYFEPLLIAALLYFLMVVIITFFAKKLERKLAYA